MDKDEKPTQDKEKELAAQLGSVAFFSDLDEGARVSIASEIRTVQLAENDILVRQGEDAESMYLLIEGRLSVVLEQGGGAGQVIADLRSGSIVGEIALVAGGKRSATVRASTASTIGVLTNAAFNRLLDLNPDIASRVAETVSRRLREGQLAVHLAHLFADIEPDVLKELEADVEWMSLAAGETLFRQGAPADACYLVVSGRLRAMAEGDTGVQRAVDERGPGQIAGELAVLMDDPYSATLIAMRDTDLACIPRKVFDNWQERHPKAMLQLTRAAVRRSRMTAHASAARHREEGRSVAFVALDADFDPGSLIESIADRMAGYGATISLSSERVDSLLQKSGVSQSTVGSPAHIRLLQWLNEIEKAHRFVVYLADCDHCEWSERVIRQADHVVFVADAAGESKLRKIEIRYRSLLEIDPLRASLLLLHPSGTDRPEQTARWLRERTVDAVYHVRRDNQPDLARLARILAGRAVGLVLGGGGARGFAHLGVFRALEELGVPIDMIGGTSIGAPLAVAPAQGMDAATALETVSISFRSLLDYTLPMASMIAGRRITRSIDRHALSWDIEDLWLPFFCVSTNMTQSRSIVHRRGNLARAVRASVSIPGVLPPVPYGDDLHVDGGALNNLPIDVMRRLNPRGIVIAVDVLPPMGPRAKSDYPLGLSGWSIALSRINPWQKAIRVPPVGSTLLAAMTIGSAGALKGMIADGLADLYLNINVKGVSMLQFDDVKPIAGIGYEQSIDRLRKWAAEHGEWVSHGIEDAFG